MKQLGEEQLRKISALIMNPRPGSKIAAAQEFGIDLTLTFEQLKKTPQERLENLQSALKGLEEIVQAGAESRKQNDGRI